MKIKILYVLFIVSFVLSLVVAIVSMVDSKASDIVSTIPVFSNVNIINIFRN